MTDFAVGDRVVIADHRDIIEAYRGRHGVIIMDYGNGNVSLHLDHHPFQGEQPGDVVCQTEFLLPEQHLIEELPV